MMIVMMSRPAMVITGRSMNAMYRAFKRSARVLGGGWSMLRDIVRSFGFSFSFPKELLFLNVQKIKKSRSR